VCPASFCRTHDKKPRRIRRLIGRAERNGFSQCGAPGVPVAAAAGLERRVGGKIKIRPAVPAGAGTRGAFWRVEARGDRRYRKGWVAGNIKSRRAAGIKID
jgi:hypothetical protein